MSIFDDVINEQREMFNKAGKLAAKQLGQEIHDTFRTAVDKWYASYEPNGGRGYHLQELDHGVHGKRGYYNTIGKGEFLCGIYVDPSYMSGNPYQKNHGWTFMNPSIAFNLAYIGGVHGFDEEMVEMANATRGKVVSIGKKGRRKWNPQTIPGKTSPSPDEEMESKFESVFTYDKVMSVVESYMG